MKSYWDSLTASEQESLAIASGTSRQYLRLIFNGHKKAGFQLAISIENLTHGHVTKQQLRPDIYARSNS